MSGQLPRTQRSALTRDRIIVAVAQSLGDQTYEDQSLAAIMKRAGVSTGAFYFHFASKEEAARAVLVEQYEYSMSRAVDRVAQGGEAIALLLETSVGLMRDVVADPVVRGGARATTTVGLLDPLTLATWNGWAALNVVLLNAAIVEGSIRSNTDVQGTAEFIVASIAGIGLRCHVENNMPRVLPRVGIMWGQFIDAHTTTPERWHRLARSLFEARPPKPLTFAEYQARHRHEVAPRRRTATFITSRTPAAFAEGR